MTRPYITCRERIDFIADYVAGELDASSGEDFERHLDRCASCQAYLKSYRITMRLGRVAADRMASDVPEELVRVIMARRRQ